MDLGENLHEKTKKERKRMREFRMILYPQVVHELQPPFHRLNRVGQAYEEEIVA